MILAGDIGGTKTNVALFEEDADKLGAPITQQSFPSKQYDSLDAIIKEYIAAHPAEVKYACFGIAGPVVGGRVETPNLAWVVDGNVLAQTIGVARVDLINDLEATAYGIEGLKDAQLFTLNEGDPTRVGHRALIAAGTGLGMAGIFWDGRGYPPLASEGGHADSPARTDLETELLNYLTEKAKGHVAY